MAWHVIVRNRFLDNNSHKINPLCYPGLSWWVNEASNFLAIVIYALWPGSNTIVVFVLLMLCINLSLSYFLPQNNPEIESFWSPLSFETSFAQFHWETKMWFQKTFFRLFYGIGFFMLPFAMNNVTETNFPNDKNSKIAKKN